MQVRLDRNESGEPDQKLPFSGREHIGSSSLRFTRLEGVAGNRLPPRRAPVGFNRFGESDATFTTDGASGPLPTRRRMRLRDPSGASKAAAMSGSRRPRRPMSAFLSHPGRTDPELTRA
jgi:hypothetical protein